MIGVLLFVNFIAISRCTLFPDNIICGAYEDYVPTDPLNYSRYFPCVIKLFRCRGADNINSLLFNKCVPGINGTQNVNIIVFNSIGRVEEITVLNHTSCYEKCAIDATSCSPYQIFSPDDCLCNCKYNVKPEPDPCIQPFHWEESMCNCVCSNEVSRVCEKEKEFSDEYCGCFCKLEYVLKCAKDKRVIDEDTCECIAPGIVKGTSDLERDGTYVAFSTWVAAFESLVIVMMILTFYFYCFTGVCSLKRENRKPEKLKCYGTLP